MLGDLGAWNILNLLESIPVVDGEAPLPLYVPDPPPAYAVVVRAQVNAAPPPPSYAAARVDRELARRPEASQGLTVWAFRYLQAIAALVEHDQYGVESRLRVQPLIAPEMVACMSRLVLSLPRQRGEASDLALRLHEVALHYGGLLAELVRRDMLPADTAFQRLLDGARAQPYLLAVAGVARWWLLEAHQLCELLQALCQRSQFHNPAHHMRLQLLGSEDPRGVTGKYDDFFGRMIEDGELTSEHTGAVVAVLRLHDARLLPTFSEVARWRSMVRARKFSQALIFAHQIQSAAARRSVDILDRESRFPVSPAAHLEQLLGRLRYSERGGASAPL